MLKRTIDWTHPVGTMRSKAESVGHPIHDTQTAHSTHSLRGWHQVFIWTHSSDYVPSAKAMCVSMCVISI